MSIQNTCQRTKGRQIMWRYPIVFVNASDFPRFPISDASVVDLGRRLALQHCSLIFAGPNSPNVCGRVKGAWRRKWRAGVVRTSPTSIGVASALDK